MTVVANELQQRPVIFQYGAEIEAEIEFLSAAIRAVPPLAAMYDPRWLAIQLLEGDEALLAKVGSYPNAQQVNSALAASHERLQQVYGDDVDVALVNRRYEFVHQLVQDAVIQDSVRRVTRSDKIDRIVTHPVWGLPIFLGVMWASSS